MRSLVVTLALVAGVAADCDLTADTDCYGNDIANKQVLDLDNCCNLCQSTPDCKAFTYEPTSQGAVCWMKTSCDTTVAKAGATAGVVTGPTPPPTPPGPDNGTPLSLQACDVSSLKQSWSHSNEGLGRIFLPAYPMHSCMDCDQCLEGSNVHMWDCRESSPGTGAAPYPAQAFDFKDGHIVNIASGQCLHRTDNVELEMRACGTDKDFQFTLDTSSGLLKDASGNCVEATYEAFPPVGCWLKPYKDQPWCDTSKTTAQRTALLLKEMTMQEKDVLLHGSSGVYTGNTPINMRLGIPMLNMNDGPQGFRADGSRGGTSTQFPCSMSVGASFNPEVAFQWGEVMGEEFVGKGSNVQLGPGVNVNRVPVNGRNFEYISGEDPLLGYVLAGAAVQGIQSTGVMANAKHYINNNQETDRSTVSANIDERTRMEIYAQPFWGAVDAGVLSIMCSYNKVNDTYACENDETLNVELKGYMGYKYFVMSDWGGTHSTEAAANGGLDQQMPDGSFFGNPLIDAVANGTVDQATFDDHASRVLLAMFEIGLFDNKPVGNIDNDVTSESHSTVARTLAEEGAVLIQNIGDLLPLDTSSLTSMAVFGSAADIDVITGGGGSGQVQPKYQVSPLAGIKAWLSDHGVAMKIVTYNGTDADEAARVAKGVDISITVLATTSSEGRDRGSLDLDAVQVGIAMAVSAASSKSVALVVTPGPILMPFANTTDAVMVMFMPGQEEGAAFANLLFGSVSPSGRLPITMPNINNEMGFTQKQYPGIALETDYVERLEVGYRWYAAHSVTPAFSFGHGLTYTTFNYSNVQVDGRKISLDVRNTGSRDGTETVQLYLTYPDTAGEPPKQLRGFIKVVLKTGAMQSVTFSVSDKAVSVWDVRSHSFEVVPGKFLVDVCASATDTRLQAFLQV